MQEAAQSGGLSPVYHRHSPLHHQKHLHEILPQEDSVYLEGFPIWAIPLLIPTIDNKQYFGFPGLVSTMG